MVMRDDSVEILARAEGVFRSQVWKVVSPNVVHAPRMSEEEKLSGKQWLNLGHVDKVRKSLHEHVTHELCHIYNYSSEHCLETGSD